MEKIKNQLCAEIKRLPLILGKLLGGMMAVVGLSGAVIILVRWPNPSWPDIMPYALAGISGLVVFILCGRAIEKKKKENPGSVPAAREKMIINVVAWAILIGLSAGFLLFVIIATN